VTAAARRVRLEGVPVALFWRMEQQHDAMLREFALVSIGRQQDPAQDLPTHLLPLMKRTRRRYPQQRATLLGLMERAAHAVQETATIELDLPLGAADSLERLLHAFEEADEFCRRGELLTLASPPEVAVFRRDFVQQIVTQLRA
jgi:hypothetical protein